MLPAPKTHTDLSDTLETARRELLDLGLRNTLLNYRPLRTRGVEVVDEKPAEVFRLLVRDEKSLTFLPGQAAPSPPVADPLAQPDDGRTVAARHQDARLQTTYTSAQLQTRLLATYHAARTAVEEQGVNTLYLALGMLAWCDEEGGDEFNRAPLLLVPVELARSDARQRFHLRYTGDELGENVSLAEMLKQRFAIHSFPELPEPDDLDLPAWFEQVRTAVSSQERWSVDPDAIALGFFSFAKFLMYRDLDPATWPSSGGILGHGILQSLLTEAGFAPTSSSYREDCLLDDQLGTREVFHVMDSDSSQSIAILDALDGHNMVIQGPPGTGKSQTIVNLIAGAVAGGKRVLFVSEKMAALDVVKRRLDLVRLGGACLELHSNHTNKKSIIEELRRTALGERQAGPRASAELGLLGDVRSRLNAYCKAVNEPVVASGESPCAAYGKLLATSAALQGMDLPALRIDGAASWTAGDIARRRQLVAELQSRVVRSGTPSRQPFWGSRLMVLLPTARDEIRSLAQSCGASCSTLEQSAQSLAALFSAETPSNGHAVELLRGSAQYVLEAPPLDGAALCSPEWLLREPEILQTIASGKRHRELHRKYDAALRPEAWSADVAATRRSIAELGSRWWKFLSGRWRLAHRDLTMWSAGPPPPDQSSQLALLDAILAAAKCEQTVARASAYLAPLFGPSWRGCDSDWDLLDRQARWVIGATRGIQAGTLASWALDPVRLAVSRASVSEGLRNLDAARQAHRQAVQSWAGRLQIDESRFAEGPLDAQPFPTLLSRWSAQANGVDELPAMVAFNQLAAECEPQGLGAIAALAAEWPAAGASLASLYERARLSALLERAFKERPALAAFDGVRHGNAVAEFRRLDVLQLEYNRALLAARHAESLPSGGGAGEVGILWHEFEKRARYLPIRSLMLKAGHAIQSIKPVFMMSPLSIANYLPPGALTFDLVIFDEASQVKPIDALGAIVRGQQAVVVGDSKQLPPTSFFDSLVGTGESDPDEEGGAAADIESVLGLFGSHGAHQRMLRWHYRSRHESLIAVSNHLFYDDRLVIFPSPDRDRNRLGLIYRRLVNAPYERSRTRTNPVEAKTVAQAVMDHARAQLQLSRENRETLGVASFSTAQMEAILNHVELLRREDPSCEEFFTWPPHEPFFVKNLENVQGDERDVIFVSVGYGRTGEGFLAMSFGPLNRLGGERRLNVLISRARKRCEVFTTLCADDIDLAKSNSAGAAALKTFLHYAQTGQLDVPAPSVRPPDSDFEEQVMRQLTALGHEVHAQVGSAGFFLDLAVVDPSHPGRYILGIECDGARYHSAHSARDRDRLRQAVLEGLGWRIHRIWSTDWFHSPDRELQKVVAAIEEARKASPLPEPPPSPVAQAQAVPKPPVAGPPAAGPSAAEDSVAEHSVAGPSVAGPSVAEPSVAEPYRCAEVHHRLDNPDLHVVPRPYLAGLLAQVVTVESPVHWTDAARRVLACAGLPRFTPRLQQAFEEAVQAGVSERLFSRRGEFLWSGAAGELRVRDRSALPAVSRKIDLVPPEEIRRAILLVVEDCCGIAPADVPAAVCRLLGFTRLTDDIAAAVEPQRDTLLRDGVLSLQGLNLVTT